MRRPRYLSFYCFLDPLFSERLAWPEYQCAGSPVYQHGGGAADGGALLYQLGSQQSVPGTNNQRNFWFVGPPTQGPHPQGNCNADYMYLMSSGYLVLPCSSTASPDDSDCAGKWVEWGVPGCDEEDGACYAPAVTVAAASEGGGGEHLQYKYTVCD